MKRTQNETGKTPEPERENTERQKQDGRARAEGMIRERGNDPLQIMSLDNPDNFFFFGPEECGVVLYTLAGRRALCLGDPICREEDLDRLIRAFSSYCAGREYRCIFSSVNREVAEALRANGFAVSKYGEEAILDLSEYTLSGNRRGAMRRNVAKLERYGCFSEEYRPEDGRDEALEREIFALQHAWLDEKELTLTYSVGDLQFDHTYGRRYFITRNAEGTLLSIVTFVPYRQEKGWCIDVMYRKTDGPTGAMEHAIISAVRKLQAEGAEEISLNLAPLAGLDPSDPEAGRGEGLMHAAFCTMDYGYDFKGLYRFKEKFGPTSWRPRYLAYDRRISMVRLITSIADVKGAMDRKLVAQYMRFFLGYTFLPKKFKERKGDTL